MLPGRLAWLLLPSLLRSVLTVPLAMACAAARCRACSRLTAWDRSRGECDWLPSEEEDCCGDALALAR